MTSPLPPQTPKTPRIARALTLPETLVALAVTAILIATALTTVSQSRRHAQVSASLANLHVFASGTAFYANDNDERVWTFSWQSGPNPVGNAESSQQAAADQAIDILRRRTGRADIPRFTAWFPHVFYSHLVLADYLGEGLPAHFAVSPGDRNRRLWANNPEDIANLPTDVRPSDNETLARWPYSSSYQLPPAFYSPDQISDNSATMSQGSTHATYTGSAGPLGNRRLTEVAFPAHKVMLHEYADFYHADRPIFFAYAKARIPMMFADGSAAARPTNSANIGFRPNAPTVPGPIIFSYTPAAWEPPTLSGAAVEQVVGYYRWTRAGLRGRDFDAPEVPVTP